MKKQWWKERAVEELSKRVLLEVRLATAERRAALSVAKVKAGLSYAAMAEFKDYPAGTLELGTALDAIDMVARDIIGHYKYSSEQAGRKK